jgi:hypothetical protein
MGLLEIATVAHHMHSLYTPCIERFALPKCMGLLESALDDEMPLKETVCLTWTFVRFLSHASGKYIPVTLGKVPPAAHHALSSRLPSLASHYSLLQPNRTQACE